MTRNDGVEEAHDPIEAAFTEFREAWNDGKRLDPETFISTHPECGDELRKRIDRYIYVAEGLRSLRDDKPDDGADQAKRSTIPAGKVIGDFRIIGEIGSGGMGTVYEAVQLSLRRPVALKILPTHLSISNDAVLKFRREAEAGSRQTHPGIVAVYAVGEVEGTHYIAQELVKNGFTLAERLEVQTGEDTQLPGYFRKVARLIAEVADALQHAHASGVIHRDVKPSNILITPEGRPKLTDFGLAQVEDALSLSRTGEFAGTPYYMSPEQAMSRRIGIDERTDIFSLGVTFYEILTGIRPFEGETTHDVLKKILFTEPRDPAKVNPRVPRDLSVICLKALEKQPDRRYSTMSRFADDLGRFLTGDVILAKPPGPWTRVMKRIRKNPALSTAIGVAAAALLAFLLYVFWSYPQILSDRNRILRLSDMKRLTELKAEADGLWPAYSERVRQEMGIWLRKARDLAGRLDIHRATLLEIEAGAQPGTIPPLFADTEEQWQHDMLAGLIKDLEAFTGSGIGTIEHMERRIEFARTIRWESIEKPEQKEKWLRAAASIADRAACPRYNGLGIEPQPGLVPLGRDRFSGLWEFAHLQTGTVPERGSDGRLILTAETGLVFVLIPGGSFRMGAVPPTGEMPVDSPNRDPEAREDEGPVHPVTVAPFFLSKYEMTQGQWLRFTGSNPSIGKAGGTYGSRRLTLLHPIENVSCEMCEAVLFRLDLELPSEAQWEYAARGGTATVWWTGSRKNSLQGAVNLADMNYKKVGDHEELKHEEWLDDGYAPHAPVDALDPNPFGLHNVMGNVWEWCRDRWHDNYFGAPSDGSSRDEGDSSNRVTRGGAMNSVAKRCRMAYRRATPSNFKGYALGCRPVRTLD